MSDLEEVDVEQQLKKAEESGEDTASIILTDKSDIDSDDDDDDEDTTLSGDDEKDPEEDDMGQAPRGRGIVRNGSHVQCKNRCRSTVARALIRR